MYNNKLIVSHIQNNVSVTDGAEACSEAKEGEKGRGGEEVILIGQEATIYLNFPL